MAPKRRGKTAGTGGARECDVTGVRGPQRVHIGGQLNNRHNHNNKVNKFKRRGRPGKEGNSSVLLRSKIDFVVKKAGRLRRRRGAAARWRGHRNINSAVSKHRDLVNKIDVDILMDTGIGGTEDKEDTSSCRLRVTCGDNSGVLCLHKLDSGSRGASVLCDGVWITPNDFQALSGRGQAKDWKRSIKHGARSLKALGVQSREGTECSGCAMDAVSEGSACTVDTDTENTQTADEGASEASLDTLDPVGTAGRPAEADGGGPSAVQTKVMDIPCLSDEQNGHTPGDDEGLSRCAAIDPAGSTTRVKGYSVSDILGEVCDSESLVHNGDLEEVTCPEGVSPSVMTDPEDEDEEPSDDVPSHTIITVPIKRGRGRPPKKKRGRLPHKVFKISIPQKRAKLDDGLSCDKAEHQLDDQVIRTSGSISMDSVMGGIAETQAKSQSVHEQDHYLDTSSEPQANVTKRNYTQLSANTQGLLNQEHAMPELTSTVSSKSNVQLQPTIFPMMKDRDSAEPVLREQRQPVRFWDDPPSSKLQEECILTKHTTRDDPLLGTLNVSSSPCELAKDQLELKINKPITSEVPVASGVTPLKDRVNTELEDSPNDCVLAKPLEKPKREKVCRLQTIIDALATSKVNNPPAPDKVQPSRNPRKNAAPRQCLANSDVDDMDIPSPPPQPLILPSEEKLSAPDRKPSPYQELKLSPKPEKEAIPVKSVSKESLPKTECSPQPTVKPLEEPMGMFPGLPPPMMNIPPAMYMNMFPGGMPLEWQMHMAMMNRQLGPYELALLASSLNAQNAHFSNKLSIPDLNGRSASIPPSPRLSPNSCLPKAKPNPDSRASSKNSDIGHPLLGNFPDMYNPNVFGPPSAASHLNFLDHLQPKPAPKSPHVPPISSQNRVTNISNSYVSTWNPHKQLQHHKEQKGDKKGIPPSPVLDLSRKHPCPSSSSTRNSTHSAPRPAHHSASRTAHHNGPMDLSYRK